MSERNKKTTNSNNIYLFTQHSSIRSQGSAHFNLIQTKALRLFRAGRKMKWMTEILRHRHQQSEEIKNEYF